jgi:hypothetical protein
MEFTICVSEVNWFRTVMNGMVLILNQVRWTGDELGGRNIRCVSLNGKAIHVTGRRSL